MKNIVFDMVEYFFDSKYDLDLLWKIYAGNDSHNKEVNVWDLMGDDMVAGNE